MKRIITLLFAILPMMAMAQTGKYVGDLYIAILAEISPDDLPLPNQSVELTSGATPGTIDLSLYNFSLGDDPIGDIVLPGLKLEKSADSDTLRFAANEKVNLSLADGAIDATATINTAESYLIGKHLHAKLDVEWVTPDANMPINVLFDGTWDAPAGINSLTLTDAKQKAYTLDGRPALKAQKGIVIVGGKKTLVK